MRLLILLSEEFTVYRYETHLHTSPASRCAHASVEESVNFYKALGYAGIFITNHFLDGNFGGDRTLSYEKQLDLYFADYYEAKKHEENGFSVFLGVEHSYRGTDFLVYHLAPEWYYDHPECLTIKKSELLPLMQETGALIIQAHPFREATYIDHIRLFPRAVHGIEVLNASRNDAENAMAALFADHYGLLHFAGSDNHSAAMQGRLGGMESVTPVPNERVFAERVLAGEMHPFVIDNPMKSE